MTTGSIFWLVVVAASGGVFVFVGLLMERFSEKDWHKNLSDFRRSKSRMVWGEWIVIAGIVVEIGVGIFSAVDAWQTRQMAIKDDPLNQPISEISANLHIEVKATNFDIKNPILLEHTWLNLSGTPFSLEAKDAPHWFEHLDNFANHHVAYYTIVLKFEYNNLPTTVWNDINNTNDLYDLMFPSITVADAISKITGLETYVEFIPKNTEIVKGSGRIFINGFRKDFQFTSNSVGNQFYQWNPDRTGLFLTTTNAIPK